MLQVTDCLLTDVISDAPNNHSLIPGPARHQPPRQARQRQYIVSVPGQRPHQLTARASSHIRTAGSDRRVRAAIQDLALSPDALNPLDAFKGALYRDDLPGYRAAAAAHTLGHAAEPFEALAARYNLPFDEEDMTVTVQTKTSTETTTTTTTQVGGCV